MCMSVGIDFGDIHFSKITSFVREDISKTDKFNLFYLMIGEAPQLILSFNGDHPMFTEDKSKLMLWRNSMQS